MSTEAIVETIVDNGEQMAENIEKPIDNSTNREGGVAPTPKKRGRPAGSKDRAPRLKKVVLVEEPILAPAEPTTPEPTPVAATQPMAREVQQLEPEPRSPRTVLREASRNILELKRLESTARKSHMQDMYSKGLRSF